MRGRATLVWTLVIAVSCRSAAPRLVDAPPLLPPAPHRRPYTHRDSLALAELDEYIHTLRYIFMNGKPLTRPMLSFQISSQSMD